MLSEPGPAYTKPLTCLFRRRVWFGHFLVGIVNRSKEHVVVETKEVLP